MILTHNVDMHVTVIRGTTLSVQLYVIQRDDNGYEHTGEWCGEVIFTLTEPEPALSTYSEMFSYSHYRETRDERPFSDTMKASLDVAGEYGLKLVAGRG